MLYYLYEITVRRMSEMEPASWMNGCSRTGILRSPKDHVTEPTLDEADGRDWNNGPMWPAFIQDDGCKGASQTQDRTDEVL